MGCDQQPSTNNHQPTTINLLIAIVSTILFPAAAVTNGICEVSSTYSLPVGGERLRELTLTLVADASPSNNFEIALGHADGDRLGFLDEDIRLGYDCGAWYAADTARGTHDMWPMKVRPAFATCTTNVWTMTRRSIGREWNAIRLTRRGDGEVSASLTLDAKKTYSLLILR